MKEKLTRKEFVRQVLASKIYLLEHSNISGYDLNKNGGFKRRRNDR